MSGDQLLLQLHELPYLRLSIMTLSHIGAVSSTLPAKHSEGPALRVACDDQSLRWSSVTDGKPTLAY